MKNWRSENGEAVLSVGEHTCGTAYCLAGYQAALAGYPRKFLGGGLFIYNDFIESLTGNGSWSDASYFLYRSNWPDSREAALERIQYVIDHNGEYPPRSVWKDFGFKGEYAVSVVRRI